MKSLRTRATRVGNALASSWTITSPSAGAGPASYDHFAFGPLLIDSHCRKRDDCRFLDSREHKSADAEVFQRRSEVVEVRVVNDEKAAGRCTARTASSPTPCPRR